MRWNEAGKLVGQQAYWHPSMLGMAEATARTAAVEAAARFASAPPRAAAPSAIYAPAMRWCVAIGLIQNALTDRLADPNSMRRTEHRAVIRPAARARRSIRVLVY